MKNLEQAQKANPYIFQEGDMGSRWIIWIYFLTMSQFIPILVTNIGYHELQYC